MIPLRDDIPSRTTPFVNYTMIAICAVVFLAQQSTGGDRILAWFAMIPRRMLDPGVEILIQAGYGQVYRIEPAFITWLTPLTCTFLHAGWLHFLGNMWFLWIFGDNVEDRMGHVRYAVFYLVAGVAASAAHWASNLDSTMPTVGASGAIAGVMGAYMLMYPRARVTTLLPLFIIMYVVVVPAPVFLGVWFVLQLYQGVGSIGNMHSGGVAWWAHIGGFLLGMGAALFWKRRKTLKVEVHDRRPGGHSGRMYTFDSRRRR